MDVGEVVRTIASVATAGGVAVAAFAFRHAREQTCTTFEDSLAREYRDIVGSLPLSTSNDGSSLGMAEKQAMMRYFDLSNEQLRLIDEGRIRPATAAEWRAGIAEVMGLPAFSKCWDELSGDLPPSFFTCLNALVYEARRPESTSIAHGD
jgi:hypothetical protein